MIMVQKPVHMLSTPTYHRRHPSAPPTVLVQPTRIPGLLSLSKPPSVTPPRPNQHQAHHNRHPRSTQNNKPKSASTARQSLPPSAAVLPLLSDASNNPTPVAQLPTKPQTLPVTPSPQEKLLRGRQSSKQSKDKQTLRSNSQSLVPRSNNRRHNSQHHQGSPPNPSHLPSQAEVTNNPNPPTPYSLHTPQHNSFDLFLVSSESESDNPPSTPTKANPLVRPAPKLASRPTGKLARRRQNVGGVPSTPTPSKALSVPRPTAQPHSWDNRSLNLSRSVPTLSSIQSNGAIADVFPICDDLTDVEDDDDVFASSTPIRSKSGNTTRQRQPAMYDDGPRTAPISTPRSGFPFNSKPVPTVTPERKRQHARSPSEGIFNLSMDEDSALSSPSDGGLKAQGNLSTRRRIVSAASSGKRDFWASSKFQNSPSPDVLPVPAFKAQVALQ